MHVQDVLDTLVLGEGALSYVDLGPEYQIVFYADAEGKPLRDRLRVRMEVPLYEWAPEKVDDIVVGVLNEASKGFTVTVPTWGDLSHSFWARRRGHLSAFIYHPSLEGKFSVPGPTVVFHSEAVDPHRVLCLGARGTSGALVVRVGEKVVQNCVITNPTGVLSVQVVRP